MDQSFLTGLENITKLLQNTEDINVVSKYIEQVTRAMVSVPLPNIYTSFFRAEREFLPDYRDVDFDQRFKNVIYDRTFGTIGRGDDPHEYVSTFGARRFIKHLKARTLCSMSSLTLRVHD